MRIIKMFENRSVNAVIINQITNAIAITIFFKNNVGDVIR